MARGFIHWLSYLFHPQWCLDDGYILVDIPFQGWNIDRLTYGTGHDPNALDAINP